MDEAASANIQRHFLSVFLGAASPTLSLEEYRSSECALMSVEFLKLSLEALCGDVLL